MSNERFSDFKYEIIDNVVLVKIYSDLSVFSKKGLEKFLDDMSHENISLVFDLTEVTYINSDCIGLIIRKTRNIKSVVINSSSRLVQDVLNVVNIGKLIPVVKTIEEAFRLLGVSYDQKNKNN